MPKPDNDERQASIDGNEDPLSDANEESFAIKLMTIATSKQAIDRCR